MKTKGSIFSQSVNKMVGSRIREARGNTLTQLDLAQSVRLGRSSIAKIEAGTQGLAVDTLLLIAKKLGKDPATLLPKITDLPLDGNSAEVILQGGRAPEGVNSTEINSILKVIGRRELK